MEITFGKRLSNEQGINFWTSLGHILQSGNSVQKGVETMLLDERSKIPKKLMREVLNKLDQGYMFYEVVQEHEKEFGAGLWRQVQVAEQTGRLPEGMLRIAKQLKSSGSTTRKIKGAMVYPALMLFIGLGVGFWLITTMLPTMQETLGDLGGELPSYTVAVIEACDWLKVHWVISIVACVSLVAFVMWLIKSPLKLQWHTLIFKSPLTGKISLDSNFARIYTLFVHMIANGSTEDTALKVAASSSSNLFIANDLMKCADLIARDGISIATAFKESKTVPSEDRLLLEIGAASGREGLIMEDLAARRAEVAEETMSQLTELISPLSTLIVGGVVAFVVIVCYLPMMTMTYSIG